MNSFIWDAIVLLCSFQFNGYYESSCMNYIPDCVINSVVGDINQSYIRCQQQYLTLIKSNNGTCRGFIKHIEKRKCKNESIK